MTMDTNLLLHEEIKVLRAQNERKTKKKTRRNADLGTNTILSVQEGQERVQQLDREPRQRAPRRCSGCGTIGHTIRSCPNK